jgi:hypothetical protein
MSGTRHPCLISRSEARQGYLRLTPISTSWEGGQQRVVLWTLTPAEGGTRIRMEQSGFRPDQQAAYQGANYGWQKFFGGLERVLDGSAS